MSSFISDIEISEEFEDVQNCGRASIDLVNEMLVKNFGG
jgi:hypothetical protein